MAGGGDEASVLEGRQRGEFAGELAEVGAGFDEGGGAFEIEGCGLEDFMGPGARVDVDELGVGGVGLLGDGAAAEAEEDVLRKVEPAAGGG